MGNRVISLTTVVNKHGVCGRMCTDVPTTEKEGNRNRRGEKKGSDDAS